MPRHGSATQAVLQKQHPFSFPYSRSHSTAANRSWEPRSPAATFELCCDNRNDEEGDNGRLASEHYTRSIVHNPVDLKVSDGKPS